MRSWSEGNKGQRSWGGQDKRMFLFKEADAILKVSPSKFIPVINAAHEEYISKRGRGCGGVSRPCQGLGVTLGPGESGHTLCGP